MNMYNGRRKVCNQKTLIQKNMSTEIHNRLMYCKIIFRMCWMLSSTVWSFRATDCSRLSVSHPVSCSKPQDFCCWVHENTARVVGRDAQFCPRDPSPIEDLFPTGFRLNQMLKKVCHKMKIQFDPDSHKPKHVGLKMKSIFIPAQVTLVSWPRLSHSNCPETQSIPGH